MCCRRDAYDPGCGCGVFKSRQVGCGFLSRWAWVAELFLKRKLSLPVYRMWQWWVSRSSSAVVILASLKIAAYSLKLRLVVMMTLVCSYSLLSR